MVDVHTQAQRSYNMSRIRGRDTGPEIKIRQMLRKQGIRDYRLSSSLPGRPDLVFRRQKLAVFIDGCFWHKCPADFKEPETRKEFWISKVDRNVRRDTEVNKKLASEGWKVLRFWEHQVKKDAGSVLQAIIQARNDTFNQ